MNKYLVTLVTGEIVEFWADNIATRNDGDDGPLQFIDSNSLVIGMVSSRQWSHFKQVVTKTEDQTE